MKKFKSLVLTAIGLLCSISVSAHDFAVDGIYYNITTSMVQTVEVTYRGNSYGSYSNEYIGSVVIPESVTYGGITYRVTSIGSNAFSGCSGLTSVVIPNSVTSIGSNAFSGCSGLTSVVIPNSVTSIRSYAFYRCSSLTSVVIPNSVTSIEDYAFWGCSYLTSVEIPNSVISIGTSAFYDTAWYKNQSDGVIYVGQVLYVYKGTMPSNTSIIVKDGIVSISPRAFVGCSGLTSVEIPNSVTSIGERAFYNCSGLTSVEIPNSVTSIGASTFSGCTRLTSVEIPNSVTRIGASAFSGCTRLTSVEIPNSVTSIGTYAFSGCTALSSVNIEDVAAWCNIEFGIYYQSANTVDITSNPLLYAKNLYLNGEKVTDLVIPDSVTKIGEAAFLCCAHLTSVEIPNSVTNIGNWAFYECSGLTSLVIPNGVTTIGDEAFYNCSGLTSVEMGNSLTSIGNWAFSGCSGLTSVVIPNSVTSIGASAFSNCGNLKMVLNSSNLTFTKGSDEHGYIAYYANVVVNKYDGWLGDFIFAKDNGTYYLQAYVGNETDLVLPENYKDGNYAIGASAFSGCSGLTSVVIPNSVTSIGASAFSNCENLKMVLNSSNLTFTKGSDEHGYIAYYANVVVNKYDGRIGDFIFVKDNSAYYLQAYVGNETDLVLPENYKDSNYAIGVSAFRGCSGLTSVVMGNSVTSIGDGAFNECSGLTTVKISNSVTTIPYASFKGCTSLTSVTIPNNVTSVGESAFYGCENLEYLYISSEIASIGDYAFYDCENLLDIQVASRKAISANEKIFSEATYNNAYLYVPNGRKFAYEKTTPWNRFFITEMDFTRINDVITDAKTPKVYYDLNGRIVTNPTKGIYILNGKKVWVK